MQSTNRAARLALAVRFLAVIAVACLAFLSAGAASEKTILRLEHAWANAGPKHDGHVYEELKREFLL
jgi:hypothetical protein